MSDLARRAAVFAAISDPARLRIVDLLTLGDLASSEIMAELGMSSNLVAFHLSVLHERGIVRRTRSEGDGRRTYVHLVPTAFDALAPEPLRGAPRVLFVCTQNSARSQLAEAAWAAVSDIPAASAGTEPGSGVHPQAIAAARRAGLTIAADAHPKSWSAIAREDDFVISVCDRAHETLAGRDRVHWSIADPARVGTPAAFDHALRDVRTRVDAVARRLLSA